MVSVPVNRRAARARHPDAIVLEADVWLATVFVLADEGLEGGAERACHPGSSLIRRLWIRKKSSQAAMHTWAIPPASS